MIKTCYEREVEQCIKKYTYTQASALSGPQLFKAEAFFIRLAQRWIIVNRKHHVLGHSDLDFLILMLYFMYGGIHIEVVPIIHSILTKLMLIYNKDH